jgi:glycosyltransferase involved in cell wall biosynthesis
VNSSIKRFEEPSITVVIPAYNASDYLRSCLDHLSKSTVSYECIVVDDGSSDDTRQVAASFGVKVLSTGGRRGPALARNLGAKAATGTILYFIDADVCVYPWTLARIVETFQNEPQLDALIGSYDDSPRSKDFLSQYKNLMHCFVHQNARCQAVTFWSGCGAIRRSLFIEHSGFDESYGRPAIEDIELGYRLARAKCNMVLDADLKVKHLKSWSFTGLVKTDIVDRGIPWTELILRDKSLPNDLNIQLSQRVSVALVYLLIAMAAAGSVLTGASFILPFLALLFLILSAFEAEITWRDNPNATVGIVLLISAIVGLACWTREYWVAPPVLLAYVLLVLRHRYTYNNIHRRRVTGLACGIYLLFVGLFVLTYLPRHPLVFAVFVALGGVILLNMNFYVFLASRTGRLMALAAIPFHLLFHFYNGVSFVIGCARYLVVRKHSSNQKGAVPASSGR